MVQKFSLQALDIVGWVYVSNEHDQGLGQDLNNCPVKNSSQNNWLRQGQGQLLDLKGYHY